MRTLRGHRTTTVVRLSRIKRHEDLRAYTNSPDFLAAMRVIPEFLPSERHIILAAIARAYQRCNAAAPLLPDTQSWESSQRFRWTEERIAMLRALNERYAGDNELIARAMKISKNRVKAARSRFCRGRDRQGAAEYAVAA